MSLHAEPDESADRVTQALLGQPVWIEREQVGWLYVQTWDTYHGWIPSRWVEARPNGIPYASIGTIAVVESLFTDVRLSQEGSADILTKAVVSCELEVAGPPDEWVPILLPDGRQASVLRSDVRLKDAGAIPAAPPTGEELVSVAKRFIGLPYLWGGTSPFGLDCSGLVQLVYRICGMTLVRDAQLQAGDERAAPVEPEDLRAGDLVFFSSLADRDKVTHVGMATGDGRFVHSAGWAGVVTSGLDDLSYKDIYWGARRMLH